MKKTVIAGLVAFTAIAAPAGAMAKAPTAQQLATNFVNAVIKSAENNAVSTHKVGITCPVKGTNINPFIARIMITESSWSINEPRGVMVMTKPEEQPPGALTAILPEVADDDLADFFASDDSPGKYARGLEFHFAQPGGQFFVTVFKNGRAEVSVSAHGGKATKPFPCKVISFEELE